MPFELNLFKPYKIAGKGRKRSLLISLVAGLLFVLSTAWLIYIPPPRVISDHSLKIGDIAGEDIVINKAITIEDKEATQANRKAAMENIIPVYELQREHQENTRSLIQQWFQLLRQARKDYIKNNKQRKELSAVKKRIEQSFGLEFTPAEIRILLMSDIIQKLELDELLATVQSLYGKKILASLTGSRRSKDGTIKVVSKTQGPEEILHIDELYDLKKAKAGLKDFLKSKQLNSPDPQFMASVLMEFITPNISYSMNLTQNEEQVAASAVIPAVITLKAGKVILRKGDEVTASHMKILNLITVQGEIMEQKVSNFFLILLLLIILTWFGIQLFEHWVVTSINHAKLLVVMGATITLSAIVYRVSLFLFPLILRNISLDINFSYEAYSVFFAIPFAFGVLTIAFVFNLHSAVMFSFINSIIGAIVCQWDFHIFLYILLGNLAVSYGIEFYQRLKRTPIIKAAVLWLLPVNLVIILTYHLTTSDFDWMLLFVNLIMGTFSAVVSLILANFLIPLYEIVFPLVTELKLVELTNLNLPIFREMLEKAPGTYHHSLMVASLSEAAAQDLGISPLLTRAMALYHDIGKIDGPHFFTENHTIYQNPHPNLSPRDSAKNIITHIGDGKERAEKLKLPPIVQSAIDQHHGTKVMRFFYDKAREVSAVDSDGVDENIFRYPGKKPVNIENAILMLADQVEAASKSLASPTEEEITNVIAKIVNVNIEENQFDECEGLTFKALNIIANSFHKKLSSIYHMRISYPQFNFKEKESPDGNGRPRTINGTDRFKAVTG